MSEKKTFTFYWWDGSKNTYHADSLEEAKRDAGVLPWATTNQSLFATVDGEDDSYEWNEELKTWERKNT